MSDQSSAISGVSSSFAWCLCGIAVVAVMGFSCWFRVEAKDFEVFVSDSGAIRWSEWSRKSRCAISLERYEGIFCPKHIGERLLGLRLKLNRIIGSLNYVGDLGLKREGPGCSDCSLVAHGVGSAEEMTDLETGPVLRAVVVGETSSREVDGLVSALPTSMDPVKPWLLVPMKSACPYKADGDAEVLVGGSFEVGTAILEELDDPVLEEWEVEGSDLPIILHGSLFPSKDNNVLVASFGSCDLAFEEGKGGRPVTSLDAKGAIVCVDSGTDGVVAELLAVCPLMKGKEGCHLKFSSSNWVLEMVSSFRNMVGLSCNGHESELMALLAALKKDRERSGLVTPSKSRGKFLTELKGLKSSVNYDGKKYVSRKS
ncbi:hypothetical protein CJ030_MR8G000648 [Morella rubra]|uniref:Uncharacterized protein n=1 Tax=Morella rubra TaxID=262757 RepID=A0A6A1UTB7_9ROSI|nr:hypothetical protein CJ030_MR8G000648 [Morella rubra]